MERIYLIHGLMETSENDFKHQINEWKNDYEIIPLDLPGHGSNSIPAKDPYFQQALSWVQEQIREHGKGHVVGFSLGASIAIHVGLNTPELCESLVLIGYTPYIPESLKEIMEQNYELLIKIEENYPEMAKEYENLHGDKWYETLKCVLDDMTFHYPNVFHEQLKTIKVPTLVLNGAIAEHERNSVIEIAKANKDISVGLIPGVGHAAHSQKPDVLNSILKSFWATLDGVKQ